MKKDVRIGELVKLENTDKKKFSHENPYYLAVIVKCKIEGKTRKQTLLFTEKELAKALDRAEKNTETACVQQSFASRLLD